LNDPVVLLGVLFRMRKLEERGAKYSSEEFAAITIQTFKLPNIQIQNHKECQLWLDNELVIYPLRLLLSIVRELHKQEQGYITTEELIKIIIPLSGCKAVIDDYVNFILWFRSGQITLIGWPDCTPGSNDPRIAREYLLFLSHYGYIIRQE
jgi:hypothetical protein